MQTAELESDQPAYRAVLAEAELTTTMILHVVVCVVVVVSLFDELDSLGLMAGIVAGSWSVLRIVVRGSGPLWIVGDVVVVQAYIVMSAMSMSGTGLPTNFARLVTVAGTATISIGIAAPARFSIPSLLATFSSLTWGCSVIGAPHPLLIFGVELLPVQWVVAAVIRRLVYRAAQVVDSVSADMISTRASSEVEFGRQRYERDHWALLHDTAASTLLMVGQGSALSNEVVRRQARRDIALLSEGPQSLTSDQVNLTSELQQLADEALISVRMRQYADPRVPVTIALAVAGAGREALTNVARHSGVSAATVDVYEDKVVIKDRGCGFVLTADRAAARHGVRNSIVRRMLDVGGLAVVASEPGQGTTVTLSWHVPAGMTTQSGDGTTTRDLTGLVHGYTYGLIAAAVLLVGASVPLVVAGPHPFISGILMAANFLFVAVAVVDIKRGRLSSRIEALSLAGVTGPVIVAILPPGELLGALNWALGSVGYFVLIQLRHARTRTAVAAMALSWTIQVGAVTVRTTDAVTWELLGYDTAGILVVQLLAAMFLGYLDRAANDAARIRDRRADLVARISVEQALHRDHQRRYEDLSQTTMPLLMGLADGTMLPGSRSVQARALAESAHLRRLFQRDDDRVNSTEAALRPLLRRAEERGVAVSVEVEDRLPDLARADLEKLLAAPASLLESAATQARIVLSGSDTEAEVSVVCDGHAGTADSLESSSPGPLHVTVHAVDELVWLLVRLDIDPRSKGLTDDEHSIL